MKEADTLFGFNIFHALYGRIKFAYEASKYGILHLNDEIGLICVENCTFY